MRRSLKHEPGHGEGDPAHIHDHPRQDGQEHEDKTNLVQTWLPLLQPELEGLRKERVAVGGHVGQLEVCMKDMMDKCMDGETMAALQALMIASEDEPTNEKDPTHATLQRNGTAHCETCKNDVE